MLEKTLGSPLDCKEIQPVQPKGNQSWIFIGRTDDEATSWHEKLTHLKRPWCWERLKAGEGDNREWDRWMASPTGWTWVWASSGSWWWTGRPGVLQSMGLQRVRHNWPTELNWIEYFQISIWYFHMDPGVDCINIHTLCHVTLHFLSLKRQGLLFLLPPLSLGLAVSLALPDEWGRILCV